MAVALKSPPPVSRRRDRAAARSSRRAPVIRLRSRQHPLPLWLRVAVVAQRGTAVLGVLVVGVALLACARAANVRYDRDVAATELQDLQQRERQLAAGTATLQDDLAERVRLPNSGLVPTASDRVILAPAPEPPDEGTEANSQQSRPQMRPLGY